MTPWVCAYDNEEVSASTSGSSMTLYLDYNATTPLAPEVLESIMTALRDCWGNPSSSHEAGRQRLPQTMWEEKRQSLLIMCGCVFFRSASP